MDPSRNFLEQIRETDQELMGGENIFMDSSVPDLTKRNEIFDNYTPNEIKDFTNLTKDELLEIYYQVELEISKLRTNRGPKSKLTGLDSFFLMLVYLKTYPSYKRLGKAFNISGATAQKIIEKLITSLSGKFKQLFIKEIKKNDQLKMDVKFDDFPSVALVVDCSVQEIPRFVGGFLDVKIFYSEKHKIYCAKKELAHLPNGMVCFVSKWYPGAKHDFAVFQDNIEVYKSFLKKEDVDNNEYWSIMVDKGYEGINHYLPGIIPKKGTNISISEKRENKKIGASRVICENFYGRLKVCWGAARSKVKNDLKIYDSMFDICVALTNFLILNYPLRADEHLFFRRLCYKNHGSQADTANSSNASLNINNH